MDNAQWYRQLIQQILQRHAEGLSGSHIETQLIFDTERDHYQLLYVGWDGDKRVFGPVLHFDIKNGKI
jgi:hypothetical protein